MVINDGINCNKLLSHRRDLSLFSTAITMVSAVRRSVHGLIIDKFRNTITSISSHNFKLFIPNLRILPHSSHLSTFIFHTADFGTEFFVLVVPLNNSYTNNHKPGTSTLKPMPIFFSPFARGFLQ